MKKYCAMILTLLLSIAAFVGCAAKAPASTPTAAPTAAQTNAPAPTQTLAGAQDQAVAPKYVFLFIGDGMSYPQFQAAADYLGAVADTDEDGILAAVSYTHLTLPTN